MAINMLNEDMAERMDDGMFLTLFLAAFSTDGSLQIVNAGHTPPLVWRQEDGTIEAIPGTGPALGMIEDFEYTAGDAIELGPGDTLLAYTDGLVEARRPSRPDRLFDESGVRAVMAEIGFTNPSARTLTESLVTNVLDFSGGEREDDMTVVTIRRVDS